MIDKRFLHYRTKRAFDEHLESNEINNDSIVFIKDEKLIWTHGEFYGLSESGIEINNIENAISKLQEDIQNIKVGDGTKHIFLTLSQYNALQSYEPNALYFIIESQNWTFGGTFPIYFGTTSTLGGTFPITLT